MSQANNFGSLPGFLLYNRQRMIYNPPVFEGKDRFFRVWNKGWVQFFVLIALALVLGMFHLRVDMAKWSVFCLTSGDIIPIVQFCLMLSHTLVSILLLLLLVIRSRVVAYAVLPVVLFLWVLPTYLHVAIGPCMYSELITGALETSWDELSGLLTPDVVILLALWSVCSLALANVLRRYFTVLQQLPGRVVWSVAIGYIGTTLALVPLLASCSPRYLLPLLFVPVSGTETEKIWQRQNLIANMLNETCPAYACRVLMPYYRQVAFAYYVADYYRAKDIRKAELLPSRLVSEDDVVVVLVIGESYRSDHASWNGYARETLPQLSAERANIINFPYYKSFATSTVSSIYGILSDATCMNREAAHTSFLSVMKKHGFDNKLILCRTTQWERNPKIATVLDRKLSNIQLCENSAGVIAQIAETVAVKGRHVILLEDGTGHAPYAHERQFARFGESNMDKYDNCLLQVDDLLSGIVNELKDKKAVVFYCSDHGQSFGEQGCYMHGGALSVVKQRHVFSFVWYSDSYGAANPERILAMRNNAGKLLSHDDIYLSILSLAGIECELPTPGCGDITKLLKRADVTEFSLDEN